MVISARHHIRGSIIVEAPVGPSPQVSNGSNERPMLVRIFVLYFPNHFIVNANRSTMVIIAIHTHTHTHTHKHTHTLQLYTMERWGSGGKWYRATDATRQPNVRLSACAAKVNKSVITVQQNNYNPQSHRYAPFFLGLTSGWVEIIKTIHPLCHY